MVILDKIYRILEIGMFKQSRHLMDKVLIPCWKEAYQNKNISTFSS